MVGPVAEVSETAAGFFYASFILPPELRKIMLSNLSISQSKQEGRFVMPISRLIVRNNLRYNNIDLIKLKLYQNFISKSAFKPHLDLVNFSSNFFS